MPPRWGAGGEALREKKYFFNHSVMRHGVIRITLKGMGTVQLVSGLKRYEHPPSRRRLKRILTAVKFETTNDPSESEK